MSPVPRLGSTPYGMIIRILKPQVSSRDLKEKYWGGSYLFKRMLVNSFLAADLVNILKPHCI